MACPTRASVGMPGYIEAIIARGQIPMSDLYRMDAKDVVELQRRLAGMEVVQDHLNDRLFWRDMPMNQPRHALNPRVAIAPSRAIYQVCNANEHIPISYETLDLQAVMDCIQQNCHELMASFDTEADFILMGEEEFRAITNTPYAHNMIGFVLHRERGPSIMDIPVRVSPTIEGWCVVPKMRYLNK